MAHFVLGHCKPIGISSRGNDAAAHTGNFFFFIFRMKPNRELQIRRGVEGKAAACRQRQRRGGWCGPPCFMWRANYIYTSTVFVLLVVHFQYISEGSLLFRLQSKPFRAHDSVQKASAGPPDHVSCIRELLAEWFFHFSCRFQMVFVPVTRFKIKGSLATKHISIFPQSNCWLFQGVSIKLALRCCANISYLNVIIFCFIEHLKEYLSTSCRFFFIFYYYFKRGIN